MAGTLPAKEYLRLINGPKVILSFGNTGANVLVPKSALSSISPWCEAEITRQRTASIKSLEFKSISLATGMLFAQFVYTSAFVFEEDVVLRDQLTLLVELLRLGRELQCEQVLSEAVEIQLEDILKRDRGLITETIAFDIFAGSLDNGCKKLVVLQALQGYILMKRGQTESMFKYQKLLDENQDFERMLNHELLLMISSGKPGIGGKMVYVDPIDGKLFSA